MEDVRGETEVVLGEVAGEIVIGCEERISMDPLRE